MRTPLEIGKRLYESLDQPWSKDLVIIDDPDAVSLATFILQLLVDEVAGKVVSPTPKDALAKAKSRIKSTAKLIYEIEFYVVRLGTPEQKKRWADLKEGRA